MLDSNDKYRLLNNYSSRNLNSTQRSENCLNYKRFQLDSSNFQQQQMQQDKNDFNEMLNYQSRSFINTQQNLISSHSQRRFDIIQSKQIQPTQQLNKRYNFRNILTPPNQEVQSEQDVKRNQWIEEQEINNNHFDQHTERQCLEILNAKYLEDNSIREDTTQSNQAKVSNEKITMREDSYDQLKFDSLKLQLDNQRKLIEFQKQKMSEIQYNSTKNLNKFLNKTCNDIPDSIQKAAAFPYLQPKLHTNVDETQINQIKQDIEKARQFSFSEKKDQCLYETNISENAYGDHQHEQIQFIQFTLDEQESSKVQDSSRILEDTICKDQLRTNNVKAQNSYIQLADFPQQVNNQSVNNQPNHYVMIEPINPYMESLTAELQENNDGQQSSLTNQNQSITEKIKNLRSDIKQLFPDKAQQEIQEQIILKHNQNYLIQEPSVNQSSKLKGKQQLAQSKSLERLQSMKFESSNSRTQRDIVNQTNFLNKTSLPNFQIQRCSSKDLIRSHITKIDSHIDEINTQLQLSMKSPLNINQNYQHAQLQPINSPLVLKKEDSHVKDFDEMQILKQELTNLAQTLQLERNNFQEFKDKMFRRRDAERTKNQDQINLLKSELEMIKERYSGEVKRIEEQFNSYRITQNERIKCKIEKQKQKYEIILEQERLKCKERDNEIDRLRQQNQQLQQASQSQVYSQEQKPHLKSILKKMNECEKCQSLLINNARLVAKIQELKSQLKSENHPLAQQTLIEPKTAVKKKLNKSSTILNCLERPLQEKSLNTTDLNASKKQAALLKMIKLAAHSKEHAHKQSKCVVDFNSSQNNEQQHTLRIVSKMESRGKEGTFRHGQKQKHQEVIVDLNDQRENHINYVIQRGKEIIKPNEFYDDYLEGTSDEERSNRSYPTNNSSLTESV
eukprot:403376354